MPFTCVVGCNSLELSGVSPPLVLSISAALSDTLESQHILFNVPLRHLKKTIRAFRCNQVKRGSLCSTAVFMVPMAALFDECVQQMVSCGQYKPCEVYVTPVSALAKSQCVPAHVTPQSATGTLSPAGLSSDAHNIIMPVRAPYLPQCRLEVVFCQPPELPRQGPWATSGHAYIEPRPEVRMQTGVGSSLLLQFEGEVGCMKHLPHTSVLILMDSGASHCFAGAGLVESLGIPIMPSPHTSTGLANGTSSPIVGECEMSMSI